MELLLGIPMCLSFPFGYISNVSGSIKVVDRSKATRIGTAESGSTLVTATTNIRQN